MRKKKEEENEEVSHSSSSDSMAKLVLLVFFEYRFQVAMLLQKKKAKKAISKVAGERREREIWENVQEEESQWNNKNSLDNMIDQRWTKEGRKNRKMQANQSVDISSSLYRKKKKRRQRERERESCASAEKCQWCSGVMKWIRQESRGGGKSRTRRPGALVQQEQQQQQSSVSCTKHSSPVQCSAVQWWCLRAAIVHRSKTTKKHPVRSISSGPEKETKEKKLDTYLLTYLPAHLPTYLPTILTPSKLGLKFIFRGLNLFIFKYIFLAWNFVF